MVYKIETKWHIVSLYDGTHKYVYSDVVISILALHLRRMGKEQEKPSKRTFFFIDDVMMSIPRQSRRNGHPDLVPVDLRYMVVLE